MGRSHLVVIILVVLAVAAAIAWRPARAVHQPIQFNHAKHVGMELACSFCHSTVEEQTFASIPKLETCMACHTEPVTESPEEAKLRAFGEKGEEPGWRRVYRMPGHVYFSHRRHVVVGKVECQTCHGPMQTLTSPPERPAVKQSMNWCIDCHEQRKVTVDCLACHR